MSTSRSNTPRSSSRSKRSTTNLANLRLAPLTAKYADDSPDGDSIDGRADAFACLSASHRSAPTTPHAISRNSSRRYLGGLSRRSALYEDDAQDGRDDYGFGYAGDVEDRARAGASHLEVRSVPKAKSEAALGVPAQRQQQQHQRLSGPGIHLKRKYNPYASPRRAVSGTSTPRIRLLDDTHDNDDWLTRTGLAATSIIAEQKGQSFLATRNSQPALAAPHGDSSDDSDEGYEELAAAASGTRSGSTADDELSPISTRASRWGSRYGSRRTSRRGSFANGAGGSRTPLASSGAQAGYFEGEATLPVEAEYVDGDDDGEEGASSVGRRFTSLGGLVDRMIGFPLFQGEEEGTDGGGETSTAESEGEGGEAERWTAAENARRRAEKEKLRAMPQRRRFNGHDGDGSRDAGGGWQQDARWLFGRAREAWS